MELSRTQPNNELIFDFANIYFCYHIIKYEFEKNH